MKFHLVLCALGAYIAYGQAISANQSMAFGVGPQNGGIH